AMIAEIRERVRANYPEGRAVSGVALPDLVPLLNARDAAEAKVAAIGAVNPRRPGLLNGAIQLAKRTIARLLDWHVREQVDFNRAALAAIQAALEALNENNRALAQLADVRGPWAEWRNRWEQRLASTEHQLLRTMAEVKTGFDARIDQTSDELQQRMWGELAALRGDFGAARAEYERLIQTELRLIRQRESRRESMPAPAAGVGSSGGAAALPCLDYASLAERFRGSEEYVREKQRFYLPFFAGRGDVLDLGCGRGEFLELMREAGVSARGVELSPELAAVCRSKGLEVDCGDLLERLPALADGSLGGAFSAHMVEHLPPERLPGLIRAAAAKLRPDGVLAIETPNPECLAIFATHFYLDPTHVRPVPAGLLRFYMEESGLGRIEVHRLSPALDDAPSLASLPADFREAFFGGLDYAIVGWKL
ncbi:MAG TPA: class I SAM-dependent methyltransferase, partial [Bryobacteraceae bacterium]|nr:class I SAM-dependent methyltransferase [Bryobacteraceae bacterium]